MSAFASQHRHHQYVWLAKLGQKWIPRRAVPTSLLRAHDEALEMLDLNPNDRTAAVAWLNSLDRIVETGGDRILDWPMLEAAKLRTAGDQRKLDQTLSTPSFRP